MDGGANGIAHNTMGQDRKTQQLKSNQDTEIAAIPDLQTLDFWTVGGPILRSETKSPCCRADSKIIPRTGFLLLEYRCHVH